MKSDDIAEKYLELIKRYLNGAVTGKEFMMEYIHEFKNDEIVAQTSEDVYGVLNSLFFACDAYCPDVDPEKVAGGIGEEEFRTEVESAARQLEELIQE